MSNSFNMFGPQKKLKRKKNLVEFRAGKMKLDTDNWVYPDKRKGLVFIHQTPDGKMHFCWKDRQSDLVEDDLIVFPQEAIFKRLPECTTGRVYLLKFTNSKKLFLWMQEPREEKDAEFCSLVNEVLNKNRSETLSNGQKDINMVEFTHLLGQLNDIGALNEIDLVEILGLTQGFESHATAESDMTNVFILNTNPFQIHSNISTLTAPESNNPQSVNDNPTSSKVIDHIPYNMLSPATAVLVVDPNTVFTERTLTQLSQNSVFQSRVLNSHKTDQNTAIDIGSDAFKAAVREFGLMLSDSSTRGTLLKDMGIPDSIINKTHEDDVNGLINDIEEYFKNRKTDN